MFVEPLLLWKGDTVDPPSGIPNPEGSDAGPGVENPGDPPSHGRDSANVSGHAIPTVLHGNQYAVLYDAEPTEIDVLE